MHKATSPLLFYSLLSLLLIAASLFSLTFVAQERTIHYWDSATYHGISLWLVDMYRHASAQEVLATIYSSLGHDYNALPALLPSLFLLFSPSRSAYILAMTVLYLFPWAVATTTLCHMLSTKERRVDWRSPHIPLLTFSALLLPIAWQPLLFGFPDIVAVCVISVILLLTKDGLVQTSLKKTLATGALLILIVALRRYFAYWALPFTLYIVGESVFLALRSGKIEELRRAVRSIAALVASMLTTLLLFGRGFFTMLVKDYGTIYLPYQNNESTLSQTVRVLFHWSSPWLTFFCVVAFAHLVRRKRYRSFIIRLTVVTVMAGALFARTQSFGPQHHYLFLPLVSTLVLFGAQQLFTLHHLPTRLTLSAMLLLLSLTSMALTFSPLRAHTSIASSPLVKLLSPIAFPPPQRENVRQIQELCSQLATLGLAEKSTYVLASSHLFNRDLFAAACPEQQLSRVRAVDTRDGFPEEFFATEVVVTTTPVQLHLDHDGECSVWCLRDALFSELLPYYQKQYVGQIATDVEVSVWVKNKEIPDDMTNHIRSNFSAHLEKYLGE